MESICSRAGSSGPRRAGNDAADAPHPGAVCTAGAGPRRPGGGLAGAVLRRYRRAADSVETAADGKNDSRGAIGFGHRARIEQSADGHHGLRAVVVGAGAKAGAVFGSDEVFQQAERARRIVKNLLYFARENEPERTRVDRNEIAERTLALRSYELRVENILVECELARDLPETMADPYQLQQVVLNLLMNAEQALLQGRGQGKVKIKTRVADGHRIAMEISDDGPGVPRGIASRIFDPFFTTKPPGVGTGLGLSIVYGIVKQHGGEVTFDNQPGAGAKFTVELPVVPVPEADRSATSAHPPDR